MSTWQTRPLTAETFEDFADVVNPRRRENHCWCLSPRLRATQIQDFGQGSRERAMHCLAERGPAPGVVTYRDGKPVGWCSISPRSAIPLLQASRLIRPVDDVPVWSITCLVVRGGHRRQGVVAQMLDGALEYAASQGAPAVEAYPVDPEGRMDTTMAFVGTVAMFRRAGFEQVGTTDAVASRMPRVVMRRDLTGCDVVRTWGEAGHRSRPVRGEWPVPRHGPTVQESQVPQVADGAGVAGPPG